MHSSLVRKKEKSRLQVGPCGHANTIHSVCWGVGGSTADDDCYPVPPLS